MMPASRDPSLDHAAYENWRGSTGVLPTFGNGAVHAGCIVPSHVSTSIQALLPVVSTTIAATRRLSDCHASDRIITKRPIDTAKPPDVCVTINRPPDVYASR